MGIFEHKNFLMAGVWTQGESNPSRKNDKSSVCTGTGPVPPATMQYSIDKNIYVYPRYYQQ